MKKYKIKITCNLFFSTLNINDNLNMGDIHCGKLFYEKIKLSQQDCDPNNGDVSSGYDF